MLGQYTLSEGMLNVLFLIYTKLFYRGARLIRLPIFMRGREHFEYGRLLTTGYSCRFDLAGEGITLHIGDNCKMNDRVHIVAHKSVIIGDHVLMASNILISDTSHGNYSHGDIDTPDSPPDARRLVSRPVHIGDRVWIGEGARILPGVTLGDSCIVGSNSVVTHSFPAGTIVAGVPAKAIKRWDESLNEWVRIVE